MNNNKDWIKWLEKRIERHKERERLLYDNIEILEEELKKEKKLKWCILAGAMFGVTASCILQHFNLW